MTLADHSAAMTLAERSAADEARVVSLMTFEDRCQ